MKEDKVMEQIHAVRKKMLQDHGGDLKKLFDEVKRVEKEHGDHLVSSATRGKEGKRSSSKG